MQNNPVDIDSLNGDVFPSAPLPGEGSPMDAASSMAEQVTQSGAFESMAPPLQIALFLGGLVMLSGALVSITAFTRIVIVLSFVRRALSTQEIPPTQVIIGLSMFLTLFVMAPTFHNLHEKALSKYMSGEIKAQQAFQICKTEMLDFMWHQLDSESGHESIELFLEISRSDAVETADEVPIQVIVPAFIIHELKLAFIMGFCIYVPFLLIDLVVSTVLMSLGMMMMPPVIISTPCKLMLFVLVDGWSLIVGTLAASFVT